MSPLSILSLIRPVNSVMVGIAVLVGVIVSSPESLLTSSTLAGFATGFAISAYSMVVNDYYDVGVDRLNQPKRPLASGAVSLGAARWLAVGLLLAGLATSVFTGIYTLVIAASFAGIGWLYNYWGKRQGLIGNAMVALSVTVPYIYGGLTTPVMERPLLLAFMSLTSFLAALGREVLKTISDVAGDELRRVKSVARIHGPKLAATTCAVLYLLAIFSSWMPLLTGVAGLLYAVLIAFPDGIFLFAAFSLMRRYDAVNATRIKSVSLAGMLSGLVAFMIGGS